MTDLSSHSGDPDVFSVNTLFWKIRVTRVQQKIFRREFSVPVRHFEPSRASTHDYASTTLLTTYRIYTTLRAALLIEGVF
jgi:hypothetical protein